MAEAVKHLEKIADRLQGLVDPFDGVHVMTYTENLQKQAAEREFMKRRRASAAENESGPDT